MRTTYNVTIAFFYLYHNKELEEVEVESSFYNQILDKMDYFWERLSREEKYFINSHILDQTKLDLVFSNMLSSLDNNKFGIY